jgi:hypothetical protein
MIPGTDTTVNESAIMDYRNLLRQWLAGGLCRNEAVVRLLRENGKRSRPVPDGAIFQLMKEFGDPAASEKGQKREEDVTQETHESQKLKIPNETDRDSTNLTNLRETHRASARALPEPEKKKPEKKESTSKPSNPWETFCRELAAGVPSSLPWEAYLSPAISAYRDHRAQNRDKEWQGIFYFIQLVKAHPSVATVQGKTAFRRVDRAIRQSRPSSWEHWLGVTRDDAEAAFIDAWDKIRYFPGRTPLGNAHEQSARSPLRLNKETKERRSDGYERFISLAGWLQVGMGDRPIMLPCREVGDLLSVQPMTISRYRKWAKEDGFLREVKGAKFGGRHGEGEATEFRFDTSRFPCLDNRAQ